MGDGLIESMLILTRIMQIESVQKDGTVIFYDGSVVLADVILHCTGYAPIVKLLFYEVDTESQRIER